AMAAVESTILAQCLGLARGERLTVLTDEPRLGRALALHHEANSLGADSAVLLEQPRAESNELGETGAAAFAVSDVIVSVRAGSISHSAATRVALARGARAVSMGPSTEEMLARLLGADADAVARRSRVIAQALSASRQASI